MTPWRWVCLFAWVLAWPLLQFVHDVRLAYSARYRARVMREVAEAMARAEARTRGVWE